MALLAADPSELLDGLASGTTPDTGHGFHHKEGHSLSFFVVGARSRVASGVVSQKIHFTFMPQAEMYLSLKSLDVVCIWCISRHSRPPCRVCRVPACLDAF